MTLPELNVPTLPEAVATLKARIPAEFPVSNTDPFSRFGTFLALAAQAGIEARLFTRDLLPQGFPTLATGDWLDLHAATLSLTRIQAGRAAGLVRFTVTTSGTIPAGTVVQAAGGGTEFRYVVQQDTAVVAPSGLVPVLAEGAGAAYNVGTGRIQTLVTLLPFVQAVGNAADWLTVPGVDRETDELLRQRLLLRFPASGAGTTYHAYLLQAREVPGITKVLVLDEHPRGQGTVDVVIAPQAGAPTPAQVAAAQVLVEKRRPVTADVLVRAPVLTPQDVQLTLYTRAGITTTPQVWMARVQAVIDSLGIGETMYPSVISDRLHDSRELLGVTVAQPAGPVVVARDRLLVSAAINITIQVAP